MRRLLRCSLAAVCALTLTLAGAAGAAAQCAIGSSMPAASQQMPNATGAAASLSSLAGDNATVVIFWSNQCPWTKKYEQRVLDLASKYDGQGGQFVLVNANSTSDFPQESLSAIKEQASGYSMPYLKDQGGQLADAFGAKRTPHVFVYDGQGTLAYTGAIDDSPGDPSAVNKPYLDNVLEALTSGSTPSTTKTNAFGCVLKN
ncbi:MAG: thioredoxin family protein [Bacteroidetes bacterium QS_8_68_15]|nr:MAG: thioredoxin family protein [Bacteroidetes bacterium QS_8_68_15]